MANDGLTGIKENATGFVGWVVYGQTKSGKPELRFDLACGINNPEFNKYTTWRHCFVYGDKAKELSEQIKKGKLVKAYGWVQTEALLDDTGHQVMADGKIQLREHLILYSAEVIEHEKKAEKQIPLLVEN